MKSFPPFLILVVVVAGSVATGCAVADGAA